MLLKESLQKHEKKKTQLGGWVGGEGLQSNNFCVVVNYLICIPCIGTLYFSALPVSALIRWQEMECQYKTVVLAITLKGFLSIFKLCLKWAPPPFFKFEVRSSPSPP